MNIKELRNKTGLSQSQFAKKYNISKYTLQDWEQGKSNPPSAVMCLLEKEINHTVLLKHDSQLKDFFTKEGYKVGYSLETDTPFRLPQIGNTAIVDDDLHSDIFDRLVTSSLRMHHCVIKVGRSEPSDNELLAACDEKYKIYRLNSSNPKGSDSWDVLKELTEDQIKMLCETYIPKNSSMDDYGQQLLEAIIIDAVEKKKSMTDISELVYKPHPEISKEIENNPKSKEILKQLEESDILLNPQNEYTDVPRMDMASLSVSSAIRHSFLFNEKTQGKELDLRKIRNEKAFVFVTMDNHWENRDSVFFINMALEQIIRDRVINKQVNELPVDIYLTDPVIGRYTHLPMFDFYLKLAKAVNVNVIFAYGGLSSYGEYNEIERKSLDACDSFLIKNFNNWQTEKYIQEQISSEETLLDMLDKGQAVLVHNKIGYVLKVSGPIIIGGTGTGRPGCRILTPKQIEEARKYLNKQD